MSAELNSSHCPNCGAPVPGPGKCPNCGSILTVEKVNLVTSKDGQVVDKKEVEVPPEFTMEDHKEFVNEKAKKWGKIISNIGLTMFLGQFGLHFYNMATFFSGDFNPLRLVLPFGIAGLGMGLIITGQLIYRANGGKVEGYTGTLRDDDDSMATRRRKRRRRGGLLD